MLHLFSRAQFAPIESAGSALDADHDAIPADPADSSGITDNLLRQKTSTAKPAYDRLQVNKECSLLDNKSISITAVMEE